jgi:uncharacterized repeat protein (TIGR03806 family)
MGDSLLIRLLAGLIFWSLAAQAAPPGLDGAPPVGAFFGNKFPPSTPTSSGSYSVVEAFPNLRFRHPTRLVAEPRSTRLHVTGKEGYIWYFDNIPTTSSKTQMLDIASKIQVTDNTGLVGLAFHPDWGLAGSPNRNYFYVYYYYSPAPQVVGENVQIKGYNRLSRFTRPDGATAADPNSELILIQQYDQHDWHGGGQMFFGSDGFLYLAIGDVGADYDFYNTAQQRNKGLNGGMLRIDVNNDPSKSHAIRRQPVPPITPVAPPAGWPGSFSANYMIPNDNPWQHPDGSQLEEFWCLGLRSPHTTTLDPATGRIYNGDVGQGTQEEINLLVKGGNYQWVYKEGTANVSGKTKPSPFTGTEMPPIHSYGRSVGVCIMCGPVYRGSALGAGLRGQLLFCDHEFSKLWALPLAPDGTAAAAPTLLSSSIPSGFHSGIVSWGTDHLQEPYLVRIGDGYTDNTQNGTGRIYKLQAAAGTVADPPATLSLLGVFSSFSPLRPSAGFVPYEPIEGFWSDGASKSRWIAIPNDGTPNTAAERINSSTDPAAFWNYPNGTVLMKHFDLPVSDANPALTKKIETRFMVKGTDGIWMGFSYRWREDESDADLINAAETRDFSIPTPTAPRMQTWTYPSRADCFTCHQASAGSVLGLRPHTLNSEIFYPTTGRTANQLHTLTGIGLLNPGWTEAALATLPKAARRDDYSASVATRARSYLDANCSYCHRSGGVQPGFDLTWHTDPGALVSYPSSSNVGTVNRLLVKTYGIADAKVVAPRNAAASILHARAALVGGTGNLTQMPPLGKNRVDEEGVLLIKEWIHTLDQPHWPGAAGLERTIHSGTAFGTVASTATATQTAGSWSSAPAGTSGGYSVRWTGLLKVGANTPYILRTPFTSGSLRYGTTGALTGSSPLTGASLIASGDYVPFGVDFSDTAASGSVSNTTWRLGSSSSYVTVPTAQFFKIGSAPAIPVAVNDAVTLVIGTSKAISILANDQDNDLQPTSVALYKAPLRGTVSFADGVATYTHTAAAGAGTDRFIYTVSDASGYTSNRAEVALFIGSAAQVWQMEHFTPTEMQNPSITGWNADPDADGTPNLLEYAFGSLPRSAASRPAIHLSQTSIGGVNHVEVRYPRGAAAVVNVSPQSSTGLGTWNSADATITLTTTPTEYRLRFPTAGGKKYVRLWVTLP